MDLGTVDVDARSKDLPLLLVELELSLKTLGARGQLPSGSMLSTWRVLRSEERRVGKEC